MTQRQATLIRTIIQPGHRIQPIGAGEAEGDIQQLTPCTPENNTQGLGEQMHNSNEATQSCPERHASANSKYQFFERHEKQYHAHFYKQFLYSWTWILKKCMRYCQSLWGPRVCIMKCKWLWACMSTRTHAVWLELLLMQSDSNLGNNQCINMWLLSS